MNNEMNNNNDQVFQPEAIPGTENMNSNNNEVLQPEPMPSTVSNMDVNNGQVDNSQMNMSLNNQVQSNEMNNFNQNNVVQPNNMNSNMGQVGNQMNGGFSNGMQPDNSMPDNSVDAFIQKQLNQNGDNSGNVNSNAKKSNKAIFIGIGVLILVGIAVFMLLRNGSKSLTCSFSQNVSNVTIDAKVDLSFKGDTCNGMKVTYTVKKDGGLSDAEYQKFTAAMKSSGSLSYLGSDFETELKDGNIIFSGTSNVANDREYDDLKKEFEASGLNCN